MVNEGLRNMSRQVGLAAAGRVCHERTGVEVVNEVGVVNGVDTAIGEGCW